MRCRQTEKLIKLNQSVGEPTNRKVGDCMEFRDKNSSENEGETAQVRFTASQ